MEHNYAIAEIKRALGSLNEQLLLCISSIPGSGKSTLLREVRSLISDEVGTACVAVLAASPIPALLVAGTTLYSDYWLINEAKNICETEFHYLMDTFEQTKWFLIDDATFMPNYKLQFIDAISRMAKRADDVPFGGANVVLFCDTLTCLPAWPESSVTRFHLWPQFRHIILKSSLRQSGLLSEVCAKLREGSAVYSHIQALAARRECVLPPHGRLIFKNAPVIFANDKKAKSFNERYHKKSSALKRTFASADRLYRLSGDHDEGPFLETEFGALAPIMDSEFPMPGPICGVDESLTLTENCCVILLADLNESQVAGSVGKVRSVFPEVVVQFGPDNFAVVQRAIFIQETSPGLFQKRTQLPLAVGPAFCVFDVKGIRFEKVVFNFYSVNCMSLAATMLGCVSCMDDFMIRDKNIKKIVRSYLSEDVANDWRQAIKSQETFPLYVQREINPRIKSIKKHYDYAQ